MKKTYTEQEIDQLTEDALNALCLFVQERLGIDDGFNASIFWSGREGIIKEYIENELAWISPTDEP